MTGFALTALLFILAGAAAVKFGLHVDPENAPTRSPSWLGPPAAGLARRILDLVQEAGSDRAHRADLLDELAAMHAHDMAMRNFEGGVTPEGETPEARAVRLAPRREGPVKQWQVCTEAQPGWTDVDRAVEGLLAAGRQRLDDLLDGTQAFEFGVGAAVERDRVALCVVIQQRWLTLADDHPEVEHDGRTFLAHLGPGVDVTEIAARYRTDGGAWSAATTVELDEFSCRDDEATHVRVRLPIAPGIEDAEMQWMRSGVPGRLRSM